MEIPATGIVGGQIAAAPSPAFDLARLLERVRSEKEGRSAPGIMPVREFRDLLQKEIHRSDRTQRTMTFLIFDVASSSPRARGYQQGIGRLSSIIPSQTRREDIVGWFRNGRGRKQLGAILHRTEPEQARRVLRTVREKYLDAMAGEGDDGSNVPDIACEVYTYPWPEKTASGKGKTRELRYDDEEGVGPALSGTEAASPAARRGVRPLRRYRTPGIATIAPAGGFMAHPHPRWKRSIDFFGASLLLAILSPLLLAVAITIKLTSPGPVFFKQDRVGQSGRVYKFWKFRSMAHNYDSTAHREYLKSLIRSGDGDLGVPMKKLDKVNTQITAVGRLIRRTSIDELPQLFNVLSGEMSLVGPRPCVPYEAAEFLLWHTRRFDSVPGMTGLWQVRGKNRTTFKEMVRLDINYGLRQSLLFDLKIFLYTIPAILRDMRSA
jgi:lipopolysaccharide/colanic/teichoic acid biosynthesis glycosyltransferase